MSDRVTAENLGDCSREWLEACADHLQRRVDAGETDIQSWLDQVRAAIPTALLYPIDHRKRR